MSAPSQVPTARVFFAEASSDVVVANRGHVKATLLHLLAACSLQIQLSPNMFRTVAWDAAREPSQDQHAM